MDCFETLAENVTEVVDQLAGEDFPDLEETLVSKCIGELEGRGFDLSQFNTTQNARDVRAVMSALGYPEYNIYGVSYGTKLALEVMRTIPDGVRSVVLDSVAPPQVPLYDTLYVPHHQAIVNTFAPCEADPVCSEAYPNITQRYWNLLEQLLDEPVEVDGIEINGSALFSTFSRRNDWADPTTRGFTTYAPALVSQLEEGDVTLMRQVLQGLVPPQASAEAALAAASGLTPDEQALAQVVRNALNQMQLGAESASQALIQLEANLDVDAAPASLGEFFDDQLEQAAAGLPERAARTAFAQDYLNLRFEPPGAGALIDLVRTHFDSLTASRLSSLAALMATDDVERVFDLIAIDNATLQALAEGNFELMLYACQEDFEDGFNSLEGFLATTRGLEDVGSGMIAEMTDPPNTLYADCKLFEQHPRPNWLEPVTSDLPVLVFSGEIDTQTSSTWGPLVAQTLPNSHAIVFPEAGHGALLFSQCARDIGEAFLEMPQSAVDTSCVADLRLPYLMPDGSFHKVAQ
ncbi:hypothetical protein GCM10007385_40390 [Tateyamaria omphalii]|nr:hypothetical protein GCM10007385_40390 [Tateyamaria omphalii]